MQMVRLAGYQRYGLVHLRIQRQQGSCSRGLNNICLTQTDSGPRQRYHLFPRTRP